MNKIYPMPKKMILKEEHFDLPKCLDSNIGNYKKALELIGCKIVINKDLGKEAYKLDVNSDGIKVEASTDAGIFYAYITLLQLVKQNGSKINYLSIEDEPKYEFRAYMLDMGRYFYPLEDVYKIVDLCAIHKLNKLHMHLTEDQGWRIEIKKYPLLTMVGSKRKNTNFNCKPHEGFYTQEDIKNLIEYCKVRNIEVFPEIDMPGHMRAAIACYPELSCFDRELPVATHWGVKHDILCAGKEETYKFIYDVIDEISDLFDSKYIHIGGDEAVKTRWKLCPHCQALMKKEGIETENKLQAYFMNKVAAYIKSKGKVAITWNEDETANLDKDVVCQYYTKYKEEGYFDRITDGRKIIYSLDRCAYIDLPYGTVSLDNCLDVSPESEGIDPSKVMGIETTMWGEYAKDYDVAIKRTLPRLGALSNLMWGSNNIYTSKNFREDLKDYAKLMISFGYMCTDNMKKVNPSKFRGSLQKLWFEKRQLTWEGLHNIFDNKKVEKIAKGLKEEK